MFGWKSSGAFLIIGCSLNNCAWAQKGVGVKWGACLTGNRVSLNLPPTGVRQGLRALCRMVSHASR